MYNDEAREYLKKTFGTSVIGNCKNCIKRNLDDRRRVYNSSLICGYNSCIMQVKLELFEDEQNSKLQKQLGTKTSSMQSKIQKLNFLGFDEFIHPPWMLMRSPTGGVYWFNTKLKVYGDKLYEEVYTFNEIIVCANNIKNLKTETKQTAEMYSVHCGTMNILYDFPNAVYKTDIRFLGFKSNESLGYAVFKVKDETTGMNVSLIASKYGTRLAIPQANSVNIEAYNGGLIISLDKVGDTKQTITTDPELNVIRKSRGVIALNI